VITATATVAGKDLSASTEINLATKDIGSIEFVSADPTHIALLYTASDERPATSKVTFRVKDETDEPVPGATVNFELSTKKGGLSISHKSLETNTEGLAWVWVTAGTIATSVRVKATVDVGGVILFTQSSDLVVSTCLPDQNSFSISVDIYSPEAWDYNEVPVLVTASAADHFNNPVPDGTAVYFTTEGGRIEPKCTTQNGTCSVTWKSQAPRPDGSENVFPDDIQFKRGRVTILATAIGEESFIDRNGNGRFDPSTDLIAADLPEAFLDASEDGLRDVNEEFSDFNKDELYTDANGQYNGSLCLADDDGCSSDLVDVRDDIVIVMASSDTGEFSLTPSTVNFSSDKKTETITIYLEDENGNSMPTGSTITLTPPENADVIGPPLSWTIPDSTEPYTYEFTIIAKSDLDAKETGYLVATVTTPLGLTSVSNKVTVEWQP
jgi:hypothetical protein